MEIQPHFHALNLGGKGRPPLPFLKIEKSVLILERKVLIIKCLYPKALVPTPSNPSLPFAKGSILNVLHFSEYVYVSITVQWPYVCAASDTFRILAYSALCFSFQVYAGIVNHINHYEGIFTYIETLLRHIQAYLAKFSTLYNPSIFATLPYSEPCHI